MDPFNPDYLSERLLRVVRLVVCITVIQVVAVAMNVSDARCVNNTK